MARRAQLWKHKPARQGALSGRYYDDTAVMTVTLWCRVRGTLWGAGLSSCTEFCSPVYTHVTGSYKPRHGARARTPAAFQASWLVCPIWPPLLASQADSQAGLHLLAKRVCWQHQTSHLGKNRLGAGLWQHTPKCQPLNLDRTSPGQDCPVHSPFTGNVSHDIGSPEPGTAWSTKLSEFHLDLPM